MSVRLTVKAGIYSLTGVTSTTLAGEIKRQLANIPDNCMLVDMFTDNTDDLNATMEFIRPLEELNPEVKTCFKRAIDDDEIITHDDNYP